MCSRESFLEDELRYAEQREQEQRRRALVAKLDEDIGELAGHVNAATCRLLGLLAEFNTAEGWNDHGARSPEQWLAWRCGLSPAAARDYVRVASRLKDLPLIADAFARGEISFWQTKAVARVATPETEEALLNIARYSTSGQLERVVAAFKGAVDRAELERANDRHARRELTYYFDDDGFLMLKGQLCPEDGAVFVKAVQAAADALEKERMDAPGEKEPEGYDARRADALVELARASLATEGDKGTTTTSERYQAVVHVDVASLRDGSGERCELEDGPVIASETARRITCDGVIVPMVERDGEILDVGRKTRKVPPRLRRALEARDQTCCFPGCNARRFTQAHHIVHWIHEGETKLSNLALLCSYHHRLVHEGGFRVKVTDDGRLVFVRPDGREVPGVSGPGAGCATAVVEDNASHGIHITTRTCTTHWDGKPLDLDLCTFVLLQQAGLLNRSPPV